MAFTAVQDHTLATILWSDVAEYCLSDFVDGFTLPQVVKVLEGYHDTHEESCISIDQVLMLHEVKTTDKALVRDVHNTELCIPLNCGRKVELCPDTAATTKLGKFKFIRVTSNPDGNIPVLPGDKLEVVRVERDAEGREETIVFQNLNKKGSLGSVSLSDSAAGFQPLLDGREYFLKEVSMMEPPVFFQFIDPPEPDNQREENVFNSSLGVLKLEKVYQDSSVMCTTKEGGIRTAFTCPKTLPILVAVAQGALEGDMDYVKLCRIFHEDVSLSKIEDMESENIYASPDSIREYQYIDVVERSPTVPPRKKSQEKAKQTVSYREAIKPEQLDPAPATELLQDKCHHSVENIYEDPEALLAGRATLAAPPKSPASRDPHVRKEVGDSNVSVQMSQLSVEEVSNFLKSWHLGDFVDVFSENDVDGDILVSMDAEDMNDLGMNSFQSKKLLKLISGWRPKTDSST